MQSLKGSRDRYGRGFRWYKSIEKLDALTSKLTLRQLTLISTAAHVALIAWANHHDHHYPTMKYTDVDYDVFSDAARFITEGKSPFERSTYRYTPYLALLLTPTTLWHDWGKFLFSLTDLVVGHMLWHIYMTKNHEHRRAVIWVGFGWFLNPFVIHLSTRGSAESLILCMTVGTLYAACERRWDISGVLLGVATHFKIYPFIYAPALFFALPSSNIPLFSWPRARLTACAAGSFIGLTCVAYLMYGSNYMDEAWLYHLNRIDHRINFSSCFYSLYLNNTKAPVIWTVLQLSLSLGLSAVYSPYDLNFAFALSTLAFVALNRVITSQYFVWYLPFLAIIGPSVPLLQRKCALTLGAAWIGCQAIWLFFAHQIEFVGNGKVWLPLWAAGCSVTIVHAMIMQRLIKSTFLHTENTKGSPVLSAEVQLPKKERNRAYSADAEVYSR